MPRTQTADAVILLVDNDRASIKVTLSVLRGFVGSHPYRVELAENAEEVFRVIRMEKDLHGQFPALIFSDCSMPGLTEDDLTVEVHRHYPEIPQVLYASSMERQQKAHQLQNGTYLCWLPRPWDGIYQAELLQNTLGI